MSFLLAEMSPNKFFQIMIFAILGLMLIIAVLHYVHEVIKHRNEVGLKQSMVDRGMSAEEIEKVIKAKV